MPCLPKHRRRQVEERPCATTTSPPCLSTSVWMKSHLCWLSGSCGWAADYFAACWMGRGGHAGKRGEFDQSLSLRWTSSGGDSAVRFRSATESLRDWHRALAHDDAGPREPGECLRRIALRFLPTLALMDPVVNALRERERVSRSVANLATAELARNPGRESGRSFLFPGLLAACEARRRAHHPRNCSARNPSNCT
jgi:hypothetical protein